jgi:hypothetical protein
MAAYLGFLNSPFNYGQYFHPRRQLYNGRNSLSPVHDTAAQVKFIERMDRVYRLTTRN